MQLNDVNNNVLYEIFSHLDLAELCDVCLVCKKWKNIILTKRKNKTMIEKKAWNLIPNELKWDPDYKLDIKSLFLLNKFKTSKNIANSQCNVTLPYMGNTLINPYNIYPSLTMPYFTYNITLPPVNATLTQVNTMSTLVNTTSTGVIGYNTTIPINNINSTQTNNRNTSKKQKSKRKH